MPVLHQFRLVGTRNVGSLRSAENDVLLRVLRQVRQSAGVSQEELSRRLGQSITFVVKVERGTRRLDVVEFVALCQAVGTSPVEVLAQVVAEIHRTRTAT